jgi:hypothetical protein
MAASPAAADGDGSAGNPYTDLSTLPIELIDCPTTVPGALITMCIEMTFTGGTAKFGSVDSAISGPIKIRQVVGVVLGENGFEVVIADESSEGSGGGLTFPTIAVPGGLLGAGAAPLDPLLSPVTGITAQLEPVGGLELTELNSNMLIDAFIGGSTTETRLAIANLAFRVKINNLLLGSSCYIGSESDPVDLHLPLELTNFRQWNTALADPPPAPGDEAGYYVFDADATDATFDVPAADGCGIVELDLGSGNLFDTLVNQFVGLPAPSGTNLLSLQGYFGTTLPTLDGVPG